MVVHFCITVGVCWTATNVLQRVCRLDVPLFTLAPIHRKDECGVVVKG